jgi:hypothetical protein
MLFKTKTKKMTDKIYVVQDNPALEVTSRILDVLQKARETYGGGQGSEGWWDGAVDYILTGEGLSDRDQNCGHERIYLTPMSTLEGLYQRCRRCLTYWHWCANCDGIDPETCLFNPQEVADMMISDVTEGQWTAIGEEGFEYYWDPAQEWDENGQLQVKFRHSEKGLEAISWLRHPIESPSLLKIQIERVKDDLEWSYRRLGWDEG